MHQVTFHQFYPLGFLEEVSPTDCAPLPTNAKAESLAAPVEAGPGVRSLPFAGPVLPAGCLFAHQLAGGLDGAWFVDEAIYGSLDAPDWLPAGGHAALEVGKGYRHHAVHADGYALSRGCI